MLAARDDARMDVPLRSDAPDVSRR